MKHLALTIILDEHKMSGEIPLYEAIVRRLARMEIAGATVTTGIMGFGKHGEVHRKRLFGVADERPVTIFVVDDADSIRKAIQEIRALLPDGLICLAEVEVL